MLGATAARTALLGALVALGAAPSTAAEWEWGELTARLDSTLSLSFSVRTEDRDCKLLAQPNPEACSPLGDLATQGRLINADDANLNYDEWDTFSVLFRGTHELEMRWRDFGSFVRATYFWDAIQRDKRSTRRTDLDRDARFRWDVFEGGVVGAQFLLLDAYAWSNFQALDRHFELRVGNQVVNWGQSTFTQGGINATNTLDVARLRLAGAELKEGLLPAPIVLLGGDVFGRLGFEVYYQFKWKQTDIDPVGSFFSVSDQVGRGAQGFFTPFIPGFSQGDPGCAALVQGGCVQRDPDEIFAAGFSQGGAPLAGDEDADDQGQWGLALRYYVDAIETEFGAYYIRFHAKTPQVGFTAACPPGAPTGSACLLQPYVVSYFREFPEGNDLYGVSFNTVLGGVSLGGELSYRRDEPTPIASALPNLTDAILGTSTNPQCPGAGPSGGRCSGFVGEERLMGILNALYVAGPGTPVLGQLLGLIGAADMTLLGELAIENYPDLSDDVDYALPAGEDRIDDTAASYTLRFDASYHRVFGSAITLKPILTFRHDFYGVHPGNGSLFTKRVKTFAVQLEANYQQRWKGVLSYQNSFGAGVSNPNTDRDFLSASISYAF